MSRLSRLSPPPPKLLKAAALTAVALLMVVQGHDWLRREQAALDSGHERLLEQRSLALSGRAAEVAMAALVDAWSELGGLDEATPGLAQARLQAEASAVIEAAGGRISTIQPRNGGDPDLPLVVLEIEFTCAAAGLVEILAGLERGEPRAFVRSLTIRASEPFGQSGPTEPIDIAATVRIAAWYPAGNTSEEA